MTNKKTAIIVLIIFFSFTAHKSFSQAVQEVYVMFGDPAAEDSITHFDGGCLGTGVCSNYAPGAANIPAAATTVIYTASDITPSQIDPALGNAEKNIVYTGTITMLIRKRNFHKQNRIKSHENHRRLLRSHSYPFKSSTVPAGLIGGAAGYRMATIPAGTYSVKNPLFRPFKMTITKVSFSK